MNYRIKILLSIALGSLLVGIWLFIADVGEMVNTLEQLRVTFIFPLGILFMLVYFLRSLRWKIILSPVQKISVGESFNLCMTNYFINFLVPVHAGEVAKSMLLKKMKGTPVSKSLVTVYVDKIMDLLPFFLLIAVTPFLKKQINSIIYLVSEILLVVFIVLTLSLVIFFYKKKLALLLLERMFFFLPDSLKSRLINFANLFDEGLASLPRLSNRLAEIIGLTIMALAVHCLFMWLFFYSFGINLPVLTVLVGYLLVNASFILPAPPGFSGSLELTFIFIFTYLYGYDKNLVSVVAASSHVFIAVLFALFGLSSIALIGTRLSSLLKTEFENEAGMDKFEAN